MTHYTCPHCGKEFHPEQYGEYLKSGEITVSYKTYQKAEEHARNCPQNPNRQPLASSRRRYEEEAEAE